jgi:murein L,D-transpeptidase YcbB/YkuD
VAPKTIFYMRAKIRITHEFKINRGIPMSNHCDWFMRKTAMMLVIATASGMMEAKADSTQTTASISFAAQNYERLKAELPYYQDAASHPDKYPWPTIPTTKKLLHLGSRENAVLLVKQRLKTSHDLQDTNPQTDIFDKDLTQAVKIFQWRHGLTADGVIGADTRNAMNISPDTRAKQIEINMQRWSKLAGVMSDRYILVNIPEYQLHVIDHEQDALTMKVVVGRPTRQTPELESDITRVVFNPYWNVPQKLAQKDIIPKVLRDSNYLHSNQIRIFNNQEDNAYELNASDVNWQDALENGFQYHFRQEPGIKNSLGLVKFEFQNDQSIYLHDTPAKELFAKDTRDLSSGCIRLEKPFALVAYLTQNDSRINSARIKQTLLSKKTLHFRIENPMPIYIAYLTTWVDNKGIVHFANDVYQRDFGTPPAQESGQEE